MNRYFKFKDIMISNFGQYVLQGVTNLETGTVTTRKINYLDTDGSTWGDIWYNERPFEISGVIIADNSNDMVNAKRKLIASCNLKEKFILQYFNRKDKYQAECYFDKLPTFSARKGWNLEFKLYITIPGFYWESSQEHNLAIFNIEDKITDSFKLPCIFTERLTVAKISNLGDTDLFPNFIIKCKNSVSGSSVVIKNNTTNQTFTLNYETLEGEIITVNTAKATAISNLNGNITKHIDISSDFPKLIKGVNELEGLSPGNAVVVQFREKFLGV